MINKKRAFIIGIKGTKLKKKEILFLKKYKPWGIILFTRNIKTVSQTRKLTSNIRQIFKDKNYPIIVDEEGGRVSRLNKFIDNSIFTADFFGKLFINNKKKFKIYYDVYIKQISYLFKILGININSVPVLDVRRNNATKIIGDRSYSSNAKIVSKLGEFCIYNFHKQSIATIVKHIPGHGLAKIDSHIKLPIIKKSLKEMNRIDFLPFKNKKALFAMTAHVIYWNIDKNNAATHSKKVIQLIRNSIGYKNLILSDDISMKALKYSIKENTIRAFIAGCNLVLHCNANYSEMLQVAKNSPIINNFVNKKTSQFINIVR
jgi:beta-N-acetylhexosaminidase